MMMKMKKTKKIQTNKLFKELHKRKNHIKFRAILMAGLMLAINSFAWFTFVANGNGKLSANVISWDIQFFDDDSQVEILDIDLVDLYPGMDDYYKSIIIRNHSDLNASFSYIIEEVEIYGEKYNSDDFTTSLLNDFPFTISFNYVSNKLDIGESLSFDVNVGWLFEAGEDYCKLNNIYPFLDYINYYKPNGTGTVFELVPLLSEDYSSALVSGLYAECDDVDTYWGEKNVLFKKENPDSNAVRIKLKLIVTQRDD